MATFKLTDYGTVVFGYNETKVDTFLDQLAKNEGYFANLDWGYYHFIDFSFSNDGSKFDIVTYSSFYQENKYHSLEISEKQKELLDQGKPSPELLKLIAFAEKCQYKKRQDQIKDKFFETGNLPTDPEELVIYNDLLHQKLKETNARIIKNRIISSIVPAAYVASLIAISNTGIDTGSILKNAGIAILPTLACVCSFGIFETSPFPIRKLRADLEEKEIIEKKIRILDASEEKQSAIELRKELSIEGLENKEIKSVTKRTDAFIKELDEVKSKIAMLPEEERDSYYQELIKIVEDYYNQVVIILGNGGNKSLLGAASTIWELNVNFIPTLCALGGRISTRLSTLEAKEEVKTTLEEFKESVKDLSSGKGYVDGWTDDLSLGSGGVAYAGTRKMS